MAKRKPRTMPKAGFYVRKKAGKFAKLYEKGMREVIYTTGQTGGGGHKYCRQFGNVFENVHDETPVWATLLWSCVPGIKRLEENYDYYPEWPGGEAIDFPACPEPLFLEKSKKKA